MLRLVIEDDEGKTTIVPLIRDEITIGRKEGNTIRLTERNVSRHHARLVRTAANPPTILIEDLKSYNGVKLNGDRIADKATLKIGDLIQIGDYALALRDDTAEDQRAPAASASRPAAPAGIDAVPTAVHQVEELNAEQTGKLVVISSNIAGETYELDRRELIIGRTDENDIVVNHRSISRNHAKVIFRDDSFTIIDLASSNGVKVNGEPYGTASLVKGDIVELGQVKMRFVAPGESYVFTPTDIDDSDMLPGPGVGRLILIGMVLAAIAVGAFFLVGNNKDGPGGDGRTTPSGPGDADITAWLAEAKTHADKEEWEAAAKMYGRVLQADPDHPVATKKRTTAQMESGALRQFKRIQTSVKNKQWVDAYTEMTRIPLKSRYYRRLAPLTTQIESGYAEAELERGMLLLEDGQKDPARQVYEALRKQDFAKEQAEKLRRALERAAAPATAAPATVASVRTEPPRNPDRAPKTARPRRDRDRDRPIRNAPKTDAPKESFEDLVKNGRREALSGSKKRGVKMLERAARLRPSSKQPYQILCGVLPGMGRQKAALVNCKQWLARESNPAYRAHAQQRIRAIEDSLDQ